MQQAEKGLFCGLVKHKNAVPNVQSDKTYIRTHKTEIMDVILCVAVVFIGMCFEIPWP